MDNNKIAEMTPKQRDAYEDVKQRGSMYQLLEATPASEKPTRPRGTDSAKVIQVIETTALRGQGTNDDLLRIVTQYWDFEGNLLAENDPCAESLL